MSVNKAFLCSMQRERASLIGENVELLVSSGENQEIWSRKWENMTERAVR
jgi:hypothetical protein